MNRTNRIGRACVFLLFLLPILTAWAILICSKCGFEHPEGSVTCSHCAADLPGSSSSQEPGKAEADRTPQDAAEPHNHLDPAVVAAEIAKGQEIRKKGNEDVAAMFFMNALALEMLTDPSRKSRRAAQILDLLKQTPAEGGAAKIPCRVCNGTGKRYMTAPTFSGEAKQVEVYGAGCLACNGTGWLRAQATVNDWKMRMGAAQDEYRLLQQGRRFVPVGGAWIPLEMEGRVSVRQEALLKRTLAAPCRSCMGCGRAMCGTCQGAGKIKCPSSRCVNGHVKANQPKKTGKLATGNLTATEKCPVCHGTGMVACEKCSGKGSLLCTACNGTGQRAPCARCDGQGYSACARCNGIGIYKDAACAQCKGQGAALCTACNGNGRKK